MMNILLALLFGIIFGFLLQKGNVSNFNVIVGQLLFKNIIVLNIIMTAIIVGGTLMYALVDLNFMSALPLKASSMYGSAIGGLIFGVGMAVLGYCPGTALAAIGQGSKDALFGILGMATGALLFIKCSDFLKSTILIDTPNNTTLPNLLGVSPYLIFLILALVTFGINMIFNKTRA